VRPWARRGFGTDLIERQSRSALDGEVRFDYRPEGIVVHISIPYEQIAPQARHFRSYVDGPGRRSTAKGSARRIAANVAKLSRAVAGVVNANPRASSRPIAAYDLRKFAERFRAPAASPHV
jgi:hypothetical protein